MSKTNIPQPENPFILAVDISKETLHLHTSDGTRQTLSNNLKGLQRLAKLAQGHHAPLLVCEATGGYERALRDFAHQLEIPICILNPALIRAFARSEGMKAKNDPIDAAMILKFAQEKKPRPSPPLGSCTAAFARSARSAPTAQQ